MKLKQLQFEDRGRTFFFQCDLVHNTNTKNYSNKVTGTINFSFGFANILQSKILYLNE